MARKRPVLFSRIQSLLKLIFLALLGLIFTLSTQLWWHAIATERQPVLWGSLVENTNPSNVVQLVQRGRELYQSGQFIEAADVWKQAVSAFEAQGDRLNQAMALSNLSLTWQQLGRWDKAEEALANSLRQLPNFPAKEASQEELKILAQTLDIQGRLEFERGQPDAALKTWQQASDIYKRLKDEEAVRRNAIDQSQAQQALGLHAQACNTLLQDLKINQPTSETLSKLTCEDLPTGTLSKEQQDQVQQTLKQLPASPINAVRLRHLGDVLRMLGDLDMSKCVLNQSIAMSANLQLPQNQSTALISLGNTLQAKANKQRYLKENNYTINYRENLCPVQPQNEDAKKFYEQALSSYREAEEKSSSVVDKFQALVNQLSLLEQLQPTSGFKETKEKIKPENGLDINKLPRGRAIDYALINYAKSLTCYVQHPHTPNTDIPSWSNITQLVETAVNNAQDRGDLRTKSYALGYLGRIYEQSAKIMDNGSSQQELQERSLKAYEYTKEALVLAQSTTLYAPDIAYQWQWQLGRLLRDKGDIQGAKAAYNAAVETLNSLRSDLGAFNSDIQFNFRDEVEPVYRQLVDLLLQSENPNPDEIEEARDVIEKLQIAELNNFFRDACIKEKTIDVIDKTAAVIYTIVLDKRLEVILRLPGRDLIEDKTKLPKNFEGILDGLRKSLIDEGGINPDYQTDSKQLYEMLFTPKIKENIKNANLVKPGDVPTLVFVLDTPLRNIPMAALYDGEQHLIERYAISLTPSMKLVEPKPLGSEQFVLIAGLTKYAPSFHTPPGWKLLNNVEFEVNNVQAAVSKNKPLRDSDFTANNLKKEIRSFPFTIVHLATHGQFSSNVEETFILDWKNPININELKNLLQARDESSSNPIELLVLSACQTATGDNRATLGLAGVAVRTGARSTLATLWNVNDKSTAEFMSEFYKQLSKPKMTRAKAVRLAQLALLKNGKQPKNWASFILVGNWL